MDLMRFASKPLKYSFNNDIKHLKHMGGRHNKFAGISSLFTIICTISYLYLDNDIWGSS